MLTDQDSQELHLRILDAEARLEAAEQRMQALGDLVDSVVVFLKETHGEDVPGFRRVAHAAEEALRP